MYFILLQEILPRITLLGVCRVSIFVQLSGIAFDIMSLCLFC